MVNNVRAILIFNPNTLYFHLFRAFFSLLGTCLLFPSPSIHSSEPPGFQAFYFLEVSVTSSVSPS